MKRLTAGLVLAAWVACAACGQEEPPARVVEDVMDVSESSWIEAASFSKELTAGSGSLRVRINGEDIVYLDVPVQVWLDLKSAASPGRFYGERIKGQFERGVDEPLRERHDTTLAEPVAGRMQCAFNEECEDVILRNIEAARTSILVAAYAFTRTRIAAALVSARVRGVDVRMKIDARQAEYALAARQVAYLERNGIPVTLITMRGEYSAMHNKFMVIDGRYVIAGSYNYTLTAGAANWENVMWVESPEIAARYAAAWEAIASE